MTPAILWALPSVIVVAAIVVARLITTRRARAAKLHALAETVRGLSLLCRLDGHVYREDGTGYQCGTCGSRVDRVEGARHVSNEAARRRDIAAHTTPDQVSLGESGISTERPSRAV